MIKKLLPGSIRSRFAGDAIVALTLSALVSVLNYLYFISAGRLLTPDQFGALSALVACLTIGTLLANTRQVKVTRDIGSSRGSGALNYWRKWRRQALRAAPVPVLAAMLCVPLLALMLSVSWRDVLLMYAAQAALFGAAITVAILNGLRQIKLAYWLNLLGTCFKLLVALIAFQLGAAVAGGMAAYLAGFLAVLFLADRMLRRQAQTFAPTSAVPMQDARPNKPPRTELWTSLSYLLLVIPFTLDQVLVQTFAPDQSGAYAVIATLGKIGYFAAWPVSAVAYPYLVNTADKSLQLRIFLAGLASALVIGMFICLLFLLFSGDAVELTYGTKYSFVAGLVPWYAVAALFFIAAVSMQQIPLARGRSFALLPLLGIALLQLLLFCFHHDSLAALVSDQVIVLFVQMMVMSLFFLRRKRPGATAASDIRSRPLVMLHPHFVLPGGAGRFVLETGSLLAERGHSVIVICIRADNAIVGTCRSRLQMIEIGGPLTSTFRFWLLFPLSLWRVARVLRSIGPCVLFPQVFPANWWGFIYGLRHRDVPLLWMCHEPSAFMHIRAWIESLPSGLMKRCVNLANPVLRRLDVRLAQRADRVLCNSEYGKSLAQRIYGYPGRMVQTLLLGVDHEKFNCREDVPRAPTAVSVGRLTKFKNVALVIEAVELLVERGRHDCALMIVGRGEEETELRRSILARGLQKQVTMCGVVDDRELVRILQGARAFVLASEGEPFGLTAVEAMATGTPALVIGDGGPGETVAHNVSGFHLPARDAAALADHLEKLFYDDELFNRLSKGASARAKRFSWEACVDGIEEALSLVERQFAHDDARAEIPEIRPA